MSTQAPPVRRSAGRPLRILLVDDHPAVRYGIRELLAGQADGVTFVEAGEATTATCDLARWVDVAVIDYHLGDRDGLWMTQRIKQQPSPPPILIYSAFADPTLTAAAIMADADGLLRKTVLPSELYIAIRRLLHGRKYFPTIPRAVAVALGSRLDPLDRAIFWMLIHGLAPHDIAARLGITLAELRERRGAAVSVIAPDRALERLTAGARAPLRYERPPRRDPGLR
jgi:DNA-binding NarL/FixJ family response regulator